MSCIREVSGKETSWSQTLRSWKFRTHLKINAKRLNAKEVLKQKNGEHFIFPIADVTDKLSGRDQVFRKSTSFQDYPARGEEHNDDLQEKSDGSQPFFGRAQRFTSIVFTLNQEINSMCRKNRFQYCDTLTLSGGQTQPWMYCWKDL